MASYSPTDSGSNTPLSPVENFESNLEKRLLGVTNRQDSIQTLSLWLIHHKSHCQKVTHVWFKVLKKAKIQHRLTLFYLANDVLQNCKRKNAKIYLLAFKSVLKDAIVFVRDASIRPNLERMLNIWDERNVYKGGFVEELKELLVDTMKRTSANSKIIAEFKPSVLIDSVNKFKTFENEVEFKQRQLSTLRLDASDLEAVRQLKDKAHGHEFSKHFEESCTKIEKFVESLTKQVQDQTKLIELLEKGELFYEAQYGEARIVANAYKNFGTRIHNLQKRLEEHKKTLPSPVSSPYGSPSADAPSPGNTPPPDPTLDNVEAVDMELSDSDGSETGGDVVGVGVSAKPTVKSSVTKVVHPEPEASETKEEPKKKSRDKELSHKRRHSDERSSGSKSHKRKHDKEKSRSKSGSSHGHHSKSHGSHHSRSSESSRESSTAQDDNTPGYVPPPVKRHTKAESSTTTTDNGGNTPVKDESGGTPTQDELSDTSNPIDFLTKLISKTQKSGAMSSSNLLQNLTLLTSSVQKAKESKQTSGQPMTWGEVKSQEEATVPSSATVVSSASQPVMQTSAPLSLPLGSAAQAVPPAPSAANQSVSTPYQHSFAPVSAALSYPPPVGPVYPATTPTYQAPPTQSTPISYQSSLQSPPPSQVHYATPPTPPAQPLYPTPPTPPVQPSQPPFPTPPSLPVQSYLPMQPQQQQQQQQASHSTQPAPGFPPSQSMTAYQGAASQVYAQSSGPSNLYQPPRAAPPAEQNPYTLANAGYPGMVNNPPPSQHGPQFNAVAIPSPSSQAYTQSLTPPSPHTLSSEASSQLFSQGKPRSDHYQPPDPSMPTSVPYQVEQLNASNGYQPQYVGGHTATSPQVQPQYVGGHTATSPQVQLHSPRSHQGFPNLSQPPPSFLVRQNSASNQSPAPPVTMNTAAHVQPPKSPVLSPVVPSLPPPPVRGILRNRSNSNNVEIKTVATSEESSSTNLVTIPTIGSTSSKLQGGPPPVAVNNRPKLVRPPPTPPASALKTLSVPMSAESNANSEFVDKLKRRSGSGDTLPKPPNPNLKVISSNDDVSEGANGSPKEVPPPVSHPKTKETEEGEIEADNEDEQSEVIGNRIGIVTPSGERNHNRYDSDTDFGKRRAPTGGAPANFGGPSPRWPSRPPPRQFAREPPFRHRVPFRGNRPPPPGGYFDRRMRPFYRPQY